MNDWRSRGWIARAIRCADTCAMRRRDATVRAKRYGEGMLTVRSGLPGYCNPTWRGAFFGSLGEVEVSRRRNTVPKIGLMLPPAFATLSFAPLSAFDAINMVLGTAFYARSTWVSAKGGTLVEGIVCHDCGQTERAEDIDFDTLLVGAPPDTRKPPEDLVEFLVQAPSKIRRVASICVGAFILGEAGLLDGEEGRRTHIADVWSAASGTLSQDARRNRPNIHRGRPRLDVGWNDSRH